MTATPVITPWYSRPTPLPFDFIGTTRFVEKLTIIEKKDGVSLPMATAYGSGGGYVMTVYFIFVMTQFGDMRIEVSKNVFELLKPGEHTVIEYRRGRWTGALKGKIAR